MLLLRMSVTTGIYDPITPNNTTPTVIATSNTFGVVLPSNNSTLTLLGLDDHILADPLQRQSFRYVILAASGMTLAPIVQDVLITALGPWRILGVTPLDPAGDGAIIYSVGATLDTQLDFSEYGPFPEPGTGSHITLGGSFLSVKD